jgi:hypothetical protein
MNGRRKENNKRMGGKFKNISITQLSLAVHYASSRFYGWFRIYERDRWGIPDVSTTKTDRVPRLHYTRCNR